MKICVVGLGTIGTAMVKHISEKGFQVFGFDITKKSIDDEEIYTNWELVPKPGIYVVTVSSKSVETVCKIISEKGKDCHISVESTVPVGTCRKISESYDLQNLVYCPHRYWAKDPIMHGIKVQRVIGAVNKQSLKWGLELYRALEIPTHVCRTVEMAEMCKIAENAHRFVEIAFAEELRRICGDVNISFEEVRTACNTHFNTQILEARDGIFGCLTQDIHYLKNMTTDLPLIEGAILADNMYKTRIKMPKRRI